MVLETLPVILQGGPAISKDWWYITILCNSIYTSNVMITSNLIWRVDEPRSWLGCQEWRGWQHWSYFLSLRCNLFVLFYGKQWRTSDCENVSLGIFSNDLLFTCCKPILIAMFFHVVYYALALSVTLKCSLTTRAIMELTRHLSLQFDSSTVIIYINHHNCKHIIDLI